MPTTLAVFGTYDWAVLIGYMLLVVLLGTIASRRKTDAEGYFLAERSMPMFAVALSTVATALSVATFVGAPQESFGGDLTYLSQNIGGFLAIFIVAVFFVPRFYRAGTITIYGYIDQRFGEAGKIATSCMFLFGRLLASGARLFVAAIPVCLLIWQEPEPSRAKLILAICIIGIVGTAYVISGGIRAVIWTDTMQITVVAGAALISIALLLHLIPLSPGEIWNVLREPTLGDGHSKLRLVDFTLDMDRKFSLWTAIFAATFLNLAAYGVDHDMVQRLLTAKSPMRGSISLILSQVIGLAVVSLFLVLGLLLYVFYKRPDIMGPAAPTDALQSSIQVYPQFLLNHMPTGLAGLAMAGMFAAAQGSLDSAINAMASSAVADLYWPIRRRLGKHVDTGSRTPRVAVLVMGFGLILFAVICALVYDPRQTTILEFALGVMAFAYTGMLAVFLTALFTHRGNTASVLAALAAGIIVTTLLQDRILAWWTETLLGSPKTLAMFWRMPIGTAISFLICICGTPHRGRMHA